VDLEPQAEGLEVEGSQPFEAVRVREEGRGLRVYVSGGTEAEPPRQDSLRRARRGMTAPAGVPE